MGLTRGSTSDRSASWVPALPDKRGTGRIVTSLAWRDRPTQPRRRLAQLLAVQVGHIRDPRLGGGRFPPEQVELDGQLVQRVVERIGAARTAKHAQRRVGLGVRQGRYGPGPHLTDRGAESAPLQQQPVVEPRLVTKHQSRQQLAASQPLRRVHRDVARPHYADVDLPALREGDRQPPAILAHLAKANKRAAHLQRPAQRGERVVGRREQQPRQVVPCGVGFQAEVGEQPPRASDRPAASCGHGIRSGGRPAAGRGHTSVAQPTMSRD
jgi:hypothetical protein